MAVKYFFLLFLILIAFAAVAFILLIQGLSKDISLSQMIVNRNILYFLILIIIIAGISSWLLIRNELLKRNQSIQVNLFNQIINHVSDGIIITNLDGRILCINDAVRNLFGYTNDDFLKINFYTFIGRAKENITRYELLMRGDIKEISYQTELAKKDDSVISVAVCSRITELNNQKLLVSVFEDLTEKVTITQKLIDSSKKLERAMEGTINTLALTAEIRDPYTAGHQQRVAKLAVAIAREIGFDERRIEGIRVAACLHDIGKIYVPAEILSKPGKLKDNEFNLVKDHPQVSYELLKSVEFPWPIAEIVLQHHERLDGSGYPNGLKGKEILPEAAIIAVSDVVESMASHRPYRPAYNMERALLEILQHKGELYYPEAVDACVKLFNENNFKF